MSSHRMKLALAIVAASACLVSTASAQQQPPIMDEPAKNDPSGQKTMPGTEPAYDTPTPTAPTQPSASSTATTQTTSAEYNEAAGAENERTYQPNRPMLITGAALVVVPYVAGAIVAAQSDVDADKRNYIPIVGPWLDLGQRACSFGSACSTTDNVGSAFLIGSGVAQGVGLILAATSLAVPEKTTARVEPPRAMTQVVPVSFAQGGGIGAIGTF